MGQNLTNEQNYQNKHDAAHRIPTFTRAKLKLSPQAVFCPNGYFSPEIILSIFKYADIFTCTRASSTCKLWYESMQEVFKNMYIRRYSTSDILEDDWKMNFYRRTLSDQNLAKGLYWAESISAEVGSNDYQTCYYFVNFDGNKMVYSVQSIVHGAYSVRRDYGKSFEVDLNTMKTKQLPYATVCANGYKLYASLSDDMTYPNWINFEIIDENERRKTIERKSAYSIEYKMCINMDGSPRVLTTNTSRSVDYKFQSIEVTDLVTGQLIAEQNLETTLVARFLGDYVIAVQKEGTFLVNIFTNERVVLDPTENQSLLRHFYYCKESKILGYSTGTLIQFFRWPTLEPVSQINILDLTDGFEDTNDYYQIRITSFAFDKSKCVVALVSGAASLAIYDMNTGALIQTIYNTSDSHEHGTQIYLAPNGKIITSSKNLVIYDFLSPKMHEEVPVIFVEAEKDKLTRINLPAVELSKFAAEKLDVPLETIQHRTFYGDTLQGQMYRLTVIGSHHKDYSDREQFNNLNLQKLAEYVNAWVNRMDIKNTFQLSKCNVKHPLEHEDYYEFYYNRLREALLVCERFNEISHEWEFVEPPAKGEIIKPNNDETKMFLLE